MAGKTKHHIIYVPGLGDARTFGQDKGIKLWRRYGVTVSYLALGWASKEGLESKLTRLRNEVEANQKQGRTVSLVGVSAGASAVLNYYLHDSSIHKVILVCGVAHNNGNVSPVLLRKNPDFEESLGQVNAAVAAIQKQGRAQGILSVYSEMDMYVKSKDSIIEGAHSKKIFAWSHMSVIALTILLYGKLVARFVRSSLV